MRKFTLLIAAGCGLSLVRLASAQDCRLSGKVGAVARVHPKTGAGGGAYADRSLMYTPLFDYDHLQNVVVYADPDSAMPAVSADSDVAGGFVIQKSRSALVIKPDFLAIAKSAAIRITNETGEAVILYAAGDMPESFSVSVGSHTSVDARPAATGLYRLRCLTDPELHGKLFVAGARTVMAGPDGRYALALPPGRYKVTAWHERLPSQTQDVELKAPEAQELNFELSVRQLPEVP